jgi:4-amino-4-deoxy-L-arabinose transferase-like glycosyltransferase
MNINKHTQSPFESPRTLWALAIGFLIIWFYMLGARTLVPTDEGRYAEMGREMLATGDWITLRLNGIKYFEKPPLQNWMNALTFAVFGLGDWQARLWTGLCGLIGVASVAYTGNKLFNRRVGIIAALVLGSSFTGPVWVTSIRWTWVYPA